MGFTCLRGRSGSAMAMPVWSRLQAVAAVLVLCWGHAVQGKPRHHYSSGAQHAACSPPHIWRRIGPMCYHAVHSRGQPWPVAATTCHALGGRLLHPHSSLHAHVIAAQMCDRRSCWVGLKDEDGGGIFRFENGSAMHPVVLDDMWRGTPTPGQCALLSPSQQGKGFLDSEPCEHAHSFVCEKRADLVAAMAGKLASGVVVVLGLVACIAICVGECIGHSRVGHVITLLALRGYTAWVAAVTRCVVAGLQGFLALLTQVTHLLRCCRLCLAARLGVPVPPSPSSEAPPTGAEDPGGQAGHDDVSEGPAAVGTSDVPATTLRRRIRSQGPQRGEESPQTPPPTMTGAGQGASQAPAATSSTRPSPAPTAAAAPRPVPTPGPAAVDREDGARATPQHAQRSGPRKACLPCSCDIISCVTSAAGGVVRVALLPPVCVQRCVAGPHTRRVWTRLVNHLLPTTLLALVPYLDVVDVFHRILGRRPGSLLALRREVLAGGEEWDSDDEEAHTAKGQRLREAHLIRNTACLAGAACVTVALATAVVCSASYWLGVSGGVRLAPVMGASSEQRMNHAGAWAHPAKVWPDVGAAATTVVWRGNLLALFAVSQSWTQDGRCEVWHAGVASAALQPVQAWPQPPPALLAYPGGGILTFVLNCLLAPVQVAVHSAQVSLNAALALLPIMTATPPVPVLLNCHEEGSGRGLGVLHSTTAFDALQTLGGWFTAPPPTQQLLSGPHDPSMA